MKKEKILKTNKIYKSHLVTIAQNKRAKYEYFIEEEFEAGLILKGWEVKSLRARKADISNSYIIFRDGSAYIFGAIFQPLPVAFSHTICDPMRTRKLLMNQNEIDSLFGRVNREGYTIVSLSLYWKNIWVKIKIGLAKGKKKHDKRFNIKAREWQINKARIMKKVR